MPSVAASVFHQPRPGRDDGKDAGTGNIGE